MGELYKKIYSLDNLYAAFDYIKKASGWKEKTQNYEENLLFHVLKLSEQLKNHTYKPKPANTFVLSERGKIRFIESQVVDDRMVQRSLIDSVLMPVVQPKLIYDNAASLKGKGTAFFRRRLEYHLKSYIHKNGTDGYILLIDFKKFFDNIQHDKFLDMVRKIIPDEEVMELLSLIVYDHKIDVSYMSDEEYANCMDVPFSSLDYNANKSNYKLTGEKYMSKSFSIGSQISQIAGIFYPHPVDNYCKIVRGCKYYGRYMDDTYIIAKTKEELVSILNGIKKICEGLGIFVHPDKTQIIKLTHKFTVLKIQYIIKKDGTIIKTPIKETFTRERRKLKKYKKNLEINNMTKDDILQSYLSWRGNVAKYKCYNSLCSTDKLFIDLFAENNFEIIKYSLILLAQNK